MLSIVKIGGNVLDDAPTLALVLDALAAYTGPVVLVHGGGKRATRLAEKLGIEQTMIDGRRITDAATLEVATMVYGGLVNKQLVAGLQARGCNALGLTGADGNSLLATKRPSTPIDYGFVGDITPEGVNVPFLQGLLGQGIIPVFCALTHDGAGNLLNTNADTMASTLAIALGQLEPVQLIYVFERRGVLRDLADDNSLIDTIALPNVEPLIADGSIQGGMIPKIRNAAAAVQAGVQTVCIGAPAALADMLAGAEGVCTRVVG